MTKSNPKKAGFAARPYNRYNLYFILERESIILRKGGSGRWSNSVPSTDEDAAACGPYAGLKLPPLPSRFRHLIVPSGWCVTGRATRRPHRKSHGVVTFRELARSIATSWKEIDGETLAFCSAVEKVCRHNG